MIGSVSGKQRELKERRASHSALNSACSTSNDKVDYTAYTAAGGQNNGWKIHILARNCLPVTQTILVQALQDPLPLIPNSYFLIQDAHNILCCALWCVCGPKTFPNIVYGMISAWCPGGLARFKTIPRAYHRPLVKRYFQMFSPPKALPTALQQIWQPFLLSCGKFSSHAHYNMRKLASLPVISLSSASIASTWIKPILHSSWWTQARINPCQGYHLLQEGFGHCHTLPGCLEEELGGTWSCPKQIVMEDVCCHCRHS